MKYWVPLVNIVRLVIYSVIPINEVKLLRNSVAGSAVYMHLSKSGFQLMSSEITWKEIFSTVSQYVEHIDMWHPTFS